MIRGVKGLGLEACCTLGMVTADQARRMKAAGLDAYNHNLDSLRGVLRPDHPDPDVPATASTPWGNVREAGITVCSGGIVGMGETDDDRIGHAPHIGQPPRAARVGPDQRFGRRRGDAPGRPPERVDLGHGPDDRHGQDR